MTELAYVNGVFSPIAEARVSIEDRGYQFGDGVYEVIVAYGGRLFLPDEHLARLRTSAAAIGLAYDFDAQPLEPIMQEGLRRTGLHDAMIYIQLTRGTAPRSHAIPPGLKPNLVMTFRPLPVLPEAQRQRGVRVMTVPDTRWANCYVKAIILLPNVLARHEAVQRGFDDAVFVNQAGEVRECTSANIFIARDNVITYPPRDESVLHGITQAFLATCAESIGLGVREAPIRMEELRSADEVFMSSTAVEVLGIVDVDGHAIGDGRVGPLTRRLHEAFVSRSRRGAVVSAVH